MFKISDFYKSMKMAIAFNLPSDEATDARYDRLNRLLLELIDLFGQFSVTERTQETVRVRPSSDSSVPRRTDGLPDVVVNSCRRRRLRSIPQELCGPLQPTGDYAHLAGDYGHLAGDPSWAQDDEVFITEPPASPTVPRVRRKRCKSAKTQGLKVKGRPHDCSPEKTSEKESPTKSGKEPHASLLEPEGSMISSLLSTSLGGSLWTAVVLVLGWRLLKNR